MYSKIVHRSWDNSYVIEKNGLPYHVPHSDEVAEEWSDVDAYAKEHPEVVIEEQPPSPPTFDEMKSAKLAEINSTYDARRLRLWICWPQDAR